VVIEGRIVRGRILDTYKKKKMILCFIFISIGALVILSFSRNPTMFILVGLFWGIGQAVFVPASTTYTFEYAGSSGGAALKPYRAFSDLGIGLGPVVTGIIVSLAGYRIMFLCLALICLINLCYFQFYVRRKTHVAPMV
jgi:predicted MFS family arabinose efflux permease